MLFSAYTIWIALTLNDLPSIFENWSLSKHIGFPLQPKEAEAFLLSLSEEIQRRLEAAGMKGKRLTLKIMVRKAGAPVEPAKYGGHGICDNIAR